MILTPCPHDPINGEQDLGLPFIFGELGNANNNKALDPTAFLAAAMEERVTVLVSGPPLTWVVRPMFCMVLNI